MPHPVALPPHLVAPPHHQPLGLTLPFIEVSYVKSDVLLRMYMNDLCKDGNTGTTTDGNAERRVFSSKFIPCLQQLFNKSHESTLLDNILKLHNYISAILCVVSSIHRKIDLGLFESIVLPLNCLLLRTSHGCNWIIPCMVWFSILVNSLQLMAAMALVNFQKKVWNPTTRIYANSWSYFQEKIAPLSNYTMWWVGCWNGHILLLSSGLLISGQKSIAPDVTQLKIQ